MKKSPEVSNAVIARLPKYYSLLISLREKGMKKISSTQIAECLGYSPSQVRQDFSCFGEFGQHGYGYDIDNLIKNLAHLLDLDRNHNMVIIGAGKLGQAIAHHQLYKKNNIHVKALFDIKEGIKSPDCPVYTMDKLGSFIKENDIDVAMIATDADSCQKIIDDLYALGIRKVLNFVEIDVITPPGMTVLNINVMEGLYILFFKSLMK